MYNMLNYCEPGVETYSPRETKFRAKIFFWYFSLSTKERTPLTLRETSFRVTALFRVCNNDKNEQSC